MGGKEKWAFNFGRNRGPRLTACMSFSSSPTTSADVVVRQCTSRQNEKKGSPTFSGTGRQSRSSTFSILSICIKIFTRPFAPERAKTLTRKRVPRHEPPDHLDHLDQPDQSNYCDNPDFKRIIRINAEFALFTWSRLVLPFSSKVVQGGETLDRP